MTLYTNGEAVETGQHGEHDLLFADGEPVPDAGQSGLAFEQGTGLGGPGDQSFTLEVYDNVGNLLNSDSGDVISNHIVDGGEQIYSFFTNITGDLGEPMRYGDLLVNNKELEEWSSLYQWSGDVDLYSTDNSELIFEYDDGSIIYDDELEDHIFPGDDISFNIELKELTSADYQEQTVQELRFGYKNRWPDSQPSAYSDLYVIEVTSTMNPDGGYNLRFDLVEVYDEGKRNTIAGFDFNDESYNGQRFRIDIDWQVQYS